MQPTLTILVFEDAEKEPRMIERFAFAVERLNAAAIEHGDVQVLCVSQREQSPEAERVFAQWPAPHGLIYAEHPRADDGYPIWDICDAVRQVWDLVEGEYVTFAHAEFLYGPDRLRRCCQWLREHRPVAAMGNLRRLGVDRERWLPHNRMHNPVADSGDLMLRHWIDTENAHAMTVAWDALPTVHWSFWRSEVRTGGQMDEDIFAIRRDFFDATEFFSQTDRLAYQDIYDLVRAACALLAGRDLAPDVPRMSRDTFEAIHLDHPRQRAAFSLACYRWFLAHRDEWQGTAYADDALWSQMLSPPSTDRDRHEAISLFRRGPQGTVTRFMVAMLAWLKDGGTGRVQQYLTAQASKEVAA